MIRHWPYLHDLSTAPTAQHLHIPYFSAYSLPRITVNSKLKIKPNSINITIVVFKVQCPLTVKLHSQCYGLMHPGKLLAVASQCTVCHKVRIHILWGVIPTWNATGKAMIKGPMGKGLSLPILLCPQISKQHMPEKTLKVNVIHYLRETSKLIMSLYHQVTFDPSCKM